jgi:hypothetical protein
MPVITMDPNAKDFSGYIADVRGKYPPLQLEELRGAIQPHAQESRTNGDHGCIHGCVGCKKAQVADAKIWWQARYTQYEFTEIIVAVSILGRPKTAEMNILHVRPAE